MSYICSMLLGDSQVLELSLVHAVFSTDTVLNIVTEWRRKKTLPFSFVLL